MNHNDLTERDKKTKACVFCLGSDFDFYKEDLFRNYQIIGVTDTHTVPADPRLKNLYIKPRDLSGLDFDCIIIASGKWSNEIRQAIHGYIEIEDDKIINIGDLTDGFDEWHSHKIQESLSNHDFDGRIFVIGDSHARFFGEASRQKGMCFRNFEKERDIRFFEPDILPFVPFHVGPALAYNLNRYGTTVRAREKTEYLLDRWIPESAGVLFAFGEIDIRVHVLKQAEMQKRTVGSVLEQVIDHYMEFLLSVKNDREIFVWGPVASQGDLARIDPSYPRYGNMVERNRATELFNRIMAEKCYEKGIRFVSVFQDLIDDSYATKTEYYMDNVHIGSKAWCFAKRAFSEAGVTVAI